MQPSRFSSLALAALLQVVPLCRAVVTQPMLSTSSFAIVFRWLAGATLALGGHHAVSGASTLIVSSTKATGTNGVAFRYRILTSPHSANVFSATPVAPTTSLPPGLKLDPDPAGTITGTPTQEGTWTLRLMASDGGRASRTVFTNLTITVVANPNLKPPTLVSQPQPLTVTNGGNASFSVNASGSAPLTYQWQFAGANLTGKTTSNLTLTAVTPAAEGDYRVVVKNNSGSVTSQVAHLTVLVPPAFVTVPTSLSVTSGSPASFQVAATGTAPLTYTWFFQGAPIAGANTDTFAIPSTTTADTGDYTVQVSNAAGSITSSPAHLEVQELIATPLKFGPITSADGVVSLQLTGPIRTTYVLWVSTDLTQWTPISTNSVLDGVFSFQEPVDPAAPLRFYRATTGN